MSRRRRSRYKGPWPTDALGVDRGDTLDLVLGELNAEGESSADYKGFPVSVAGGVAGEPVAAEIIRRFPESLAARVVQVEEPSPDRIEPPCPYFLPPAGSPREGCTGCQWQHVRYERQLEYKRDAIAVRLAGVPALAGAAVLPTLRSPEPFGYRNHARFTVRKKGADAGAVGFVNRVTRRFLPVDKCLLMNDGINEALADMQGRAQGMSQISIRAGSNSGDRLIQPRLENPEIRLESGQTHLVEEILGHRFRVAASSFFQVNSAQVEAVIGILRERLGLTGAELVVDAYCGVGTFAVLLAPHAVRTIGIELSASAIDDAQENARGLENVSFVEARTEEALAGIDERVGAVVLDPPRAGCAPEVLDALKRLAPERVAMVSCDPDTMTRDLSALCDGAFNLESVQPIDMFSQTRHVEAVATLRRTA